MRGTTEGVSNRMELVNERWELVGNKKARSTTGHDCLDRQKGTPQFQRVLSGRCCKLLVETPTCFRSLTSALQVNRR